MKPSMLIANFSAGTEESAESTAPNVAMRDDRPVETGMWLIAQLA